MAVLSILLWNKHCLTQSRIKCLCFYPDFISCITRHNGSVSVCSFLRNFHRCKKFRRLVCYKKSKNQKKLKSTISALLLIATVEVGFYYSHRLLHSQSLYGFHKVDTNMNYLFFLWKKNRNITNSLPLLHSPQFTLIPLKLLLAAFLAFVVPHFFSKHTWFLDFVVLCLFVFCNSHQKKAIFYLASFVGWGVTCVSHSGYQSALNRPAHDLHHSKNTGNFGLLGVLDWLHGTRIQAWKEIVD